MKGAALNMIPLKKFVPAFIKKRIKKSRLYNFYVFYITGGRGGATFYITSPVTPREVKTALSAQCLTA